MDSFELSSDPGIGTLQIASRMIESRIRSPASSRSVGAENGVSSRSSESSINSENVVDAAVDNRTRSSASPDRSTSARAKSGSEVQYNNDPPPPNAIDRNKPPPAKRLKYEDNATIKVFVGARKASFIIHKNFVCNVSMFFQGACDSWFKEASNGEIFLPEAHPEAFNIFMDWVYTKLIRFPNWPLNKASDAEIRGWWMLVAKLYVLATYLQSTTFGNAVIESICRSLNRKQVTTRPEGVVINYVYNSTVDDCGIRRLLVAFLVWRMTPASWSDEKGWKAWLAGLPAEYSHDLVIKLERRNHQLDQDPFANEKSCQIFQDTELGSQGFRKAYDTKNHDCPPAQN